jgi:hypothetical protein
MVSLRLGFMASSMLGAEATREVEVRAKASRRGEVKWGSEPRPCQREGDARSREQGPDIAKKSGGFEKHRFCSFYLIASKAVVYDSGWAVPASLKLKWAHRLEWRY